MAIFCICELTSKVELVGSEASLFSFSYQHLFWAYFFLKLKLYMYRNKCSYTILFLFIPIFVLTLYKLENKQVRTKVNFYCFFLYSLGFTLWRPKKYILWELKIKYYNLIQWLKTAKRTHLKSVTTLKGVKFVIKRQKNIHTKIAKLYFYMWTNKV